MSNASLRTLWTIIGLVLIPIGAAGFVAGMGWLPGVDARTPLLWSGLLNVWRDISPWGLSILIVLGLLFALLGLRLLSSQFRGARGPAMGDLDLRAVTGRDADGPQLPGATLIRSTKLADGLERDLARDPLIRRASVTLTGTAPRPDLWIQLSVNPRARLSVVRDRVGAAVQRFRDTSGMDPERLDITARIDPAGSARVH